MKTKSHSFHKLNRPFFLYDRMCTSYCCNRKSIL